MARKLYQSQVARKLYRSQHVFRNRLIYAVHMPEDFNPFLGIFPGWVDLLIIIPNAQHDCWPWLTRATWKYFLVRSSADYISRRRRNATLDSATCRSERRNGARELRYHMWVIGVRYEGENDGRDAVKMMEEMRCMPSRAANGRKGNRKGMVRVGAGTAGKLWK